VAWLARSPNEAAAIAESLGAIGLTLSCKESVPRTVAGFAAERARDGEHDELRVITVGDEAPAGLAGLKAGDRIVTIDGAAPAARWTEAIAHKAPGEVVTLGVARGNRALVLRVTLAAEHDTTCKLTRGSATPAVTKLRDALLTP
jgi:predicted metalloprotease with PDZ domain